MEEKEIENIVEALLLITDRAISIDKFKEIFIDEDISKEKIYQLIIKLQNEYQTRNSPVQIQEIAGGWQIATKPQYAEWLRRLFREKLLLRLSPKSLETLSIIAYKQPITKAEIEEIRGVDSTGVLETLLERKLIKIAGRKETVGRPLLYATTPDFLRYFGLVSLSDLPSLEEIQISHQQTQVPIEAESSEDTLEENL